MCKWRARPIRSSLSAGLVQACAAGSDTGFLARRGLVVFVVGCDLDFDSFVVEEVFVLAVAWRFVATGFAAGFSARSLGSVVVVALANRASRRRRLLR